MLNEEVSNNRSRYHIILPLWYQIVEETGQPRMHNLEKQAILLPRHKAKTHKI
jgi:hypothetical protein